MKNQTLADAFQAADAQSTAARESAAQAWVLANQASGTDECAALITEAQRLDMVAQDLDAASERAAEAFLTAGGVLA